MNNSHLKNSLIAAGIAVFAGVVTLGVNVAVGATTPTQDPATSGLVAPTFNGLDIRGTIENGDNNVNGGMINILSPIKALSGIIVDPSWGISTLGNLGIVEIKDNLFVAGHNPGNGGFGVHIDGNQGSISTDSGSLKVSNSLDIQGSIKNSSTGKVGINGDLNVSGNQANSGKLTVVGKVGIGTTSPMDKLHISQNYDGKSGAILENLSDGVNATTLLQLLNNSSYVGVNQGAGLMRVGGNNVNYEGIYSTISRANALALFTQGDNPLDFLTNSVLRMTIDSSGNVGVGTTNPRAKLEVNGGAGNNTAVNIYGPNNAGQTSTINLMDTNNYIQAIWGGNMVARSYNGIDLQVNHGVAVNGVTPKVSIDTAGHVTATGGFGATISHQSSASLAAGAGGSAATSCAAAEKLLSCGGSFNGWGYINSIIPNYASGTCIAYGKNPTTNDTLTVYALCLNPNQ